MKILHTADWHLGHQLHGYSRLNEHQFFLDWLLQYILDNSVDAMLVCGDIFDTANPSAASWQQLYHFLAQLSQQAPGVQVIMVAGNHDSPSKLNAPQRLLAHFNLHFIGSVPRDDQGELDLKRLLIPLSQRDGTTQAWVLALPFLRSTDLQLDSKIEDGQIRWQHAIGELYQGVAQLADQHKQAGQAVISLGHAHVSGGKMSEMSERQVLIGGQHALPSAVFPEQSDYIALGHLHLAQQIKASVPVHYSGSPLALSTSERHYKHQLKQLEWSAGELSVTAIAIPKLCEIITVPAKPSALAEALAEMAALPDQDVPLEERAYLEVKLLLDKPQTQIREKILDVIEGKGLRLAKIAITYPPSQQAKLFSQAGEELNQLKPERVFDLCYQQQFQAAPEPELEAAFLQALEQVRSGGEA